jgi:D-tyrosyl-tRNA(Tyr) deacylase
VVTGLTAPPPRPTLLVSFKSDAASVTLAAALRRVAGRWECVPLKDGEGGRASGGSASDASRTGLWRATDRHAGAAAVFLWELDERPIEADHIDARFAALTSADDAARGETPAEMLFLSRHVSSAGRASLCVHPIGNPRGDARREVRAEHGGREGVCVPPAPRLAMLYRLLVAEAAAEAEAQALAGAASQAAGAAAPAEGGGSDSGDGGLLDRAPTAPPPFDFETSFEATHHSPLVGSTPAAFLEIGSTAVEWERADAGDVWARVLARALGLGGRDAEAPAWEELSAEERACATVLLVLGGGHYMPAACDIVRASDCRLFVGHMVASYSLPRSFLEGGAMPSTLPATPASASPASPASSPPHAARHGWGGGALRRGAAVRPQPLSLHRVRTRAGALQWTRQSTRPTAPSRAQVESVRSCPRRRLVQVSARPSLTTSNLHTASRPPSANARCSRASGTRPPRLCGSTGAIQRHDTPRTPAQAVRSRRPAPEMGHGRYGHGAHPRGRLRLLTNRACAREAAEGRESPESQHHRGVLRLVRLAQKGCD